MSAPDFFTERSAVASLMTRLLACPDTGDAQQLDPLVAELQGIFANYQEQSHLLDPHLDSMVTPIMARVRSSLRSWHEGRMAAAGSGGGGGGGAGSGGFEAFRAYANPVMHRQLQVVYALCKTRGYKRVIKLFPHEVADVEPCVQALVCTDAGDHGTWETRYVLLLWLSILVLIPFDLSRVDSSLG